MTRQRPDARDLGEDDLLKFTAGITANEGGIRRGLRDFERTVVVGARRAGVGSSQTAHLLRCSCTAIAGI